MCGAAAKYPAWKGKTLVNAINRNPGYEAIDRKTRANMSA